MQNQARETVLFCHARIIDFGWGSFEQLQLQHTRDAMNVQVVSSQHASNYPSGVFLPPLSGPVSLVRGRRGVPPTGKSSDCPG